MRRSPKVTELLPLLYLRGLSTGDFVPALSAFFGSEAGLSASTVSRLSEAWQVEHERWRRRSLAAVDYVYLWADGVHFNVRLEEDRLCCLVLVGVRPDGRKELVAVQDGYREDTQSWQWPKATAKVTGDLERLLAFHDFPAEHHVHLRTTNPIESSFATVRLRQRVTKGAGSRSAGLAMAYKLLDAAQQRWRRVNAPQFVAVVRAGGVFAAGVLHERPVSPDGSNEATHGRYAA